jgi:hypothetical protein
MSAQGLALVAKTLAKKIKKSIDTKDTSIPGRETNSISVGTIRRKRAKNEKKAIAGGSAAAGATGASIGIEDVMELIAPGSSVQKVAGSDSMGKTMVTRRKDTARDIQGTPAERKKMSGGKVNYRKAGGKIGRGCGAAQRGGGKVMK